MTSIHPTRSGLQIDTSVWDSAKGTLPLTIDVRLNPKDMRALAEELNRRAGPVPEPPAPRPPAPKPPAPRPPAPAPAVPAPTCTTAPSGEPFRREVPTRDSGWVIVTSDQEGIRVSLDVGTTNHQLTAAQAHSLADALTTAARHQILTITRKDPS